MKMILLILSLPTENATIRMRIWRNLKTAGSAVLRDGVYLMPNRDACRNTFDSIAVDVIEAGGMAYVITIEESENSRFIELFNRSEDYKNLCGDIEKNNNNLSTDTANEVLKQCRKLRKVFENLVAIDFYPTEIQQQTDAKLKELELSIVRVLSPNEPHSIERVINSFSTSDFKQKVWVTRQHPKIDRLASAWLIKRFIDSQAKFLWLSSVNDVLPTQIGFDFDGATFSHVGNRVTFEVLLESFNLQKPALKRMAQLVHYLDIGGTSVPEAVGIETVLSGLCEVITDDDQLLENANTLFDALLMAFEK
jgi:hypothetical protein